jgi:hypothetical protein
VNDTTQQPDPAVAALQPRRAGEILGAALDLYGRHPLTLIALVAAMVVPLGVLNWQADCSRTQGCRITVLDGVVASTSWRTAIVWFVVPILLAAVVGALLAVATRTITAQLVGEHPGIRGALRLGLTGPGWLQQAAVLAAILVAAIVLLSLPGMYLSGLDGPLPQLAVVANLLVIVVAGLYVGVRLAMSVPAAVIEGRRWPQALTRSWSLVHGHWGHVVATLVLAWLATGLVGSLLAGVTAGFTGLLLGDGWLVRTLLQAAVMSLVVPYFLVVWVLLYLDLRARKERLDLDTLKAELRPPEVWASPIRRASTSPGRGRRPGPGRGRRLGGR